MIGRKYGGRLIPHIPSVILSRVLCTSLRSDGAPNYITPGTPTARSATYIYLYVYHIGNLD